MEKLKTTNVRDGIKRPYQSPTTSVLALNYLEGVLSMTSWEDGCGGLDDVVDGDPDGKGAKSFNIQFEDIWADDTEEDEQ